MAVKLLGMFMLKTRIIRHNYSITLKVAKGRWFLHLGFVTGYTKHTLNDTFSRNYKSDKLKSQDSKCPGPRDRRIQIVVSLLLSRLSVCVLQ